MGGVGVGGQGWWGEAQQRRELGASMARGFSGANLGVWQAGSSRVSLLP